MNFYELLTLSVVSAFLAFRLHAQTFHDWVIVVGQRTLHTYSDN